MEIFPQLIHLEVANYRDLSFSAGVSLVDYLRKGNARVCHPLKTLAIVHCALKASQLIKIFFSCPHLIKLRLWDVLMDEDFPNENQIQSAIFSSNETDGMQLKYLELGAHTAYRDPRFYRIFELIPRLKYLKLTLKGEETDADAANELIAFIMRRCKRLKKMEVYNRLARRPPLSFPPDFVPRPFAKYNIFTYN